MEILFCEEVNNIKYISGGYFVSNGLWTHPKRTIDSYEIIIVTRGTVNLFYDNQVQEIHKNEVFLIRPGIMHNGIGEAEDVSFYWLHFLDETHGFEVINYVAAIKNKIGRIKDGFSGIMIPDHFQLDMNKITILARQLLHYKEEQYYTTRISDMFMELILIEITQQYFDLYKNNMQKMQAVCDWIRANVYLRIGLSDVAKQFGYNKEYLSRVFKAEVGTTVKQYIVKIQLNHAKQRLLDTSDTIELIAASVGIQDEKVFMKLFKREEGITPTQYRKTFNKIHYNSH